MSFRHFMFTLLVAAAVVFAPGLLLAESGIPSLNTSNFSETVHAADRPVLVAFVAKWCPYCRRQLPQLEQMQREQPGRVDIYQVDIDQEPGLADAYDAHVLPTLIILYRGEVISGSAGALYDRDLRDFVSDAEKEIAKRPRDEDL